MTGRMLALLSTLFWAGARLPAQQQSASMPVSSGRFGLAAGLGVSYLSAPDVVDLANSTPGATQRLPEFRSAVEFFGTGVVPLSDDWVLKLEYTYLLASYDVTSAIGTGVAQYALTAHLPSAVLQYVLMGEPLYCLKLGAGAGFHTGTLSRKFYTLDDVFSSSGVGLLLDLEGNTAISEHLFAFLDVGLRWEWMGELTNDQGRGPAGPLGAGVTLHAFGPGAKIGLAYLF